MKASKVVGKVEKHPPSRASPKSIPKNQRFRLMLPNRSLIALSRELSTASPKRIQKTLLKILLKGTTLITTGKRFKVLARIHSREHIRKFNRFRLHVLPAPVTSIQIGIRESPEPDGNSRREWTIDAIQETSLTFHSHLLP